MTTIETIELTSTARLRVVVDEDASCPRGDWSMATGFVKIPGHGDGSLLDVPAVHEDVFGIAEAHDRLVEDSSLYERNLASSDLVERWARIFHDAVVEYDDEHGGYWFVDPVELAAGWPASPTGRRRKGLPNPLAQASGWTITPRYYLTWVDSLEIQREIIEGERRTYQQWADGEVFGVILERATTQATFEVLRLPNGGFTFLNPQGAELADVWQDADGDSLWGCYLDDEYTAQAVARENFELTPDELDALR